MKKNYLSAIVVVVLLIVIGSIAWFSKSAKNNIINDGVTIQNNQVPAHDSQIPAFVPLEKQAEAPFIKNVTTAADVKIGFHYDGDYNPQNDDFAFEQKEFYTPTGSTENFLSVSKIKDRENFSYGSTNYLPIFKSEESHSYQGTPIYIKNSANKYSLSYLGFKISDRSLISELKVELGIDYNADTWALAPETNDSSFASLFGAKTAYACGPGLYLRKVGEANLTFVQESDGIAWYKLEKPIALYNLSLEYADQNCSTMPSYCKSEADDPVECDKYFSCYYDATIRDLEKGNLRMHVYYKPNDKEGLFRMQMANVILSDTHGANYQATMGDSFDHYYKAFFH